MLRLFLLTAILMANMMTMSAAKKSSTVIDRIEPTDWFVGMKNPSVQLMVYGKGIRETEAVTTDYPGVMIDSLVRLDSPNYLLVYLNVKGAEAGTMTLKFDVKNEKGKVKTTASLQPLMVRQSLLILTGNSRWKTAGCSARKLSLQLHLSRFILKKKQ